MILYDKYSVQLRTCTVTKPIHTCREVTAFCYFTLILALQKVAFLKKNWLFFKIQQNSTEISLKIKKRRCGQTPSDAILTFPQISPHYDLKVFTFTEKKVLRIKFI